VVPARREFDRRHVLTYLIDRRLQGKNKSAVNRERFLRRYKAQIKDAVGRAIKGRSITDIENGEKVSIPVKDVNEPHFGHAHGGVWETSTPAIPNTRKATSSTGHAAAAAAGPRPRRQQRPDHRGRFHLRAEREEFMNYFFEDLELPNMVKTQLTQTVEFKNQRAGYNVSGTPSNIHVLRSLRGALGRRIAVGGPSRKPCGKPSRSCRRRSTRWAPRFPRTTRACSN
jgi:uncharacterized sporulation protein YeaH/YhbH (DUF444 family)